jgi:site-specific recombinase XerD
VHAYKYKLNKRERKLVEDYTRHLFLDEKAPNTIAKYRRDVMAFLSWMRSRKITKEAIINWKSHLVSVGYTPRTVNSMLAATNSFLSFIGQPDLRVKSLRLQRGMCSPDEMELTRRDYIRLVEAATEAGNLRMALVLESIAATGIRVSELGQITVSAVDRGGANVSNKGKTRMVIIPRALKKHLADYAQECSISSGPLFVTSSGEPVDRRWVWKSMKSLAAKAGIDSRKVYPHNLRHLFATAYWKKSHDIMRLAEAMGHSSVDTTRAYVAAGRAEQRRIVESIDLVV